MPAVTRDRQAASADRRWMVLVVVAVAQLALTATARYLAAQHSGPLAPAIAVSHGYTLAFAVSAALLGFGAILFGAILAVVRRCGVPVSCSPVTIPVPGSLAAPAE